VAPHMADCRRAEALKGVIRWALTEGESHVRELNYAPLTGPLRDRILESLETMTCGGAP